MAVSTKCRAQGGAANCANSNCPEKRAAHSTSFPEAEGPARISGIDNFGFLPKKVSHQENWGDAWEYEQALYRVQQFNDNPAAVKAVLATLTERYGTPRAGTERAVYDRGDGQVIKVPLDKAGEIANEREAFYSSSKEFGIPIAECHIAKIYGLPILIMEKIDTLSTNEIKSLQLPSWVNLIEDVQIGYTVEGKLVCYDL